MEKKRLNPLLKMVRPSATIVINELSQKLISEGKEIFKLGFGQSPFPVPEEVVESLKKNATQKDYIETKGLLSLRKEVSGFFNRNYNLNIQTEDIIVGPGSKELLYGFQLVSNHEELLLLSPSWVSYEPQGVLTNHKVVWLATKESDDWKITPNLIKEYCDNNPELIRTLILNYPSNPIGTTYSKQELKALSEVFRKYKIIVIADEIYGEVHHNGDHHSLAQFYPEGTIISTGLSKWAGAGGWRLGVLVFPKELRYLLNAMLIVASETFTSVSSPIQYAAIEAYRGSDSINTYLVNSRRILKAVGEYVYKCLTDIGISMPKPQGGFYVYPNFEKWKESFIRNGIMTSTDLCNLLLNDTGVALLPGESFGHIKTKYTARLAYVDFDGGRLLEVLKKDPNLVLDEDFVNIYSPKIVTGIQKIKSWLFSL